MFTVYLIENQINNKRYVGITSHSMQQRLTRHHRCAQHHSPRYLLHRAMKKYGTDAFTCTAVLTVSTAVEAKQQEIRLIAELQTFYLDYPAKGYNMTRGGDGLTGYKHTEDTRRKMRLTNSGRTITAEHRAKIANSKRGKPRPPHVQLQLQECRNRFCGEAAIGANNPNARQWILTNTKTLDQYLIDDIKQWCRDHDWKVSSVYAAASAGNLYKRTWRIQSIRD